MKVKTKKKHLNSRANRKKYINIGQYIFKPYQFKTLTFTKLLIGPRALKTLNSVKKIQHRMMAAIFNGNPRATIISCYSPTNVSEETELVTFYDELSSLVRSIPKHMLVIGGDMNAQIGKNGNNKYSLRNTSNRNGQHQTDFMIENRLACLNTNYQKRKGKLWTYTYANNTKAQIDYVLINKKWKNSAMNCEAYSSFEGVSTDHRIVTAKIRLSLRKNAKRTANTKHYDWALLNNKDIRDKYVLELRNRFETLQERTGKSTKKKQTNIYLFIIVWYFRYIPDIEYSPILTAFSLSTKWDSDNHIL